MGDQTPPPQTHPSLLARLRGGCDSQAWQAFVDAYGPLIYRYGRKRGLQEADAADLTQETLYEVARSIRTFHYDPGRGRFRDWLGTVTRRTLTRLSQRSNRPPTEAGSAAAAKALSELPDDAADSDWAAHFNAELLRVALDLVRPHFEEPTWRAFTRVWLEQRPAPATAVELNLSIEKVYLAKSRVLKRLQEELLKLAEDVPLFVPLT